MFLYLVTIPSLSSNHEATWLLTQCKGALRPWAGALVLWEVKSQCVVFYRMGDVTKILHQVSTERTVKKGISQWRWGAVKVPRHGGDQAEPGRKSPSLTKLEKEESKGKRMRTIRYIESGNPEAGIRYSEFQNTKLWEQPWLVFCLGANFYGKYIGLNYNKNPQCLHLFQANIFP